MMPNLEKDQALATAMAAAATAQLAYVTAAGHADLVTASEYPEEIVLEAADRAGKAKAMLTSITNLVVAVRDTDYPAAVAAAPAAARPVYNDAPASDQRLCKCGSPIKGNFATCFACKMYPGRTPGVCAIEACGQTCKPDFATCYMCSQKIRNGEEPGPEVVTAAKSLNNRPAYDDMDEPF